MGDHDDRLIKPRPVRFVLRPRVKVTIHASNGHGRIENAAAAQFFLPLEVKARRYCERNATAGGHDRMRYRDGNTSLTHTNFVREDDSVADKAIRYCAK
jgi:hypothetical protein